jgi:hypothetical protein
MLTMPYIPLKIGAKLWLGQTRYEVLEYNRDQRGKIIQDEFIAKPIEWSSLIENAPPGIKEQAKKTTNIVLKSPTKYYLQETIETKE